MEWTFGAYKLSKARAELIGPDGPVRLEKHPLDLLLLLVENAERVVTKDEIIDALWQGRFVSDSAVSTAVKQARKAVGDSGSEQVVIKTVHGRGFRFVAPLGSPVPAQPARPEDPQKTETPGRAKPSLAVLRFQYFGDNPNGRSIADAIPAELISSLSRLRWAQVIARGSSFRFTPEDVRLDEIGQRLGARYLIAGSVEAIGEQLTIFLELIASESGELIWADRFPSARSEIYATRQAIVAAVIAAMEFELPKHEAQATRHLAPAEFDAWSYFHMGLRHMYRFNETDNAHAARHFRTAIELDPEFSRAHAALSFTHWQTAFMHFDTERDFSLRMATDQADRALAIDPQDPLANFCMGRAKWLEGDLDSGLAWQERALTVNPNFAQCHYSMGLTHILSGQAQAGRDGANVAMSLSPLDPLYYAMLAVKSLSHTMEENFTEAARLGEQAARAPGTHFFVMLIGACVHELNGDRPAAEQLLALCRSRRSDLSRAMFFRSFPFQDPDMRNRLGGALERLGVG